LLLGLEIPTAPQPQGLVQGILEVPVRRLDIAILVGLADVDPVSFDTVVRQQVAIAAGEFPVVRQVIDRRRQAVAANPPGDSARQVKGVLQACRERFERFGTAEVDVFPVRVGEHRVEPEVVERLAADRHLEFVHANEVERDQVSRMMDLGKPHLLLDAVSELPVQDPPFQRAADRLRDTRRTVGRIVLLLQPIQNRVRLEPRIALQQRFDLRPELPQGILTRAIGPRGALHLARQLLRVTILSDRLLTHVQPPCDTGHRFALVEQQKQLTRANILEHGKSLRGSGYCQQADGFGETGQGQFARQTPWRGWRPGTHAKGLPDPSNCRGTFRPCVPVPTTPQPF